MRDYLSINTTDIAYNEIREMIAHGGIPSGSRINKRLIAEKLGISITPVTEALKKLVGENFIEYKNRRGYFVKMYTSEQLIEFFELRAALESIAIRLVVQNSQRGVDMRAVTTFWDAHKPSSMEAYVLKDNEFHETIIRMSANKLLMDMWIRAGYNIKSNQRGLQNSMEESWRDHVGIIEAVKKGDEARAQLLMTEHFLRAARHVREQQRVDNTDLHA